MEKIVCGPKRARATENLRGAAQFTCIFVEYFATAIILGGRLGEALEAQTFLPARAKLVAGEDRVAESNRDRAAPERSQEQGERQQLR